MLINPATKWNKRFLEVVGSAFASEHSDGPVMAVQIYRDSSIGHGSDRMPVNEKMVLDSVTRMLKEILGLHGRDSVMCP